MALTDYDKMHLSAEAQQEIMNATAAWEKANSIGDKAAMAVSAADAAKARAEAGYTTDSYGNYTPGEGIKSQQSTGAESLVLKSGEVAATTNLPYTLGSSAPVNYVTEATTPTQPNATAANTSPQQQPASDGKYYATGGSGKSFVYNPESGNIGITSNGQTRYSMKGDADYNATFGAMQADTGLSFGSSSPIAGSGLPASGTVTALGGGTNNEVKKPMADTYAGLGQNYADLIYGSQKAQQDAVDASVKGQIIKLKAQQAALEQQKRAADINAQMEYQKQINPYGYNAEAMAQTGLSKSGYSESAMIGYGNALMAALSNNNISYNDAMNEIENLKLEAELSGDTEKVNLAASILEKIANAYLDMGGKQLEVDYRKSQDDYQKEQDAKNLDYTNSQNAFNIAMRLAEMGDYSALDALGYDATAIKQAIKAKNTVSNGGGAVVEDVAEGDVIPDNASIEGSVSKALPDGAVDVSTMTQSDLNQKVADNEYLPYYDEATGQIYYFENKAADENGFTESVSDILTNPSKNGMIYIDGVGYVDKPTFDEMRRSGEIIKFENNKKLTYIFKPQNSVQNNQIWLGSKVGWVDGYLISDMIVSGEVTPIKNGDSIYYRYEGKKTSPTTPTTSGTKITNAVRN